MIEPDNFIPVSSDLQVLALRRSTTNLQSIDNRRFMYHPSGVLILGAEDMVKSRKGLLKSHAEEYGEASERLGIKLPPYDEFARGWIGVGGSYRKGIIHFAPQISAQYIPHFNAAFDFIEVSLRNGFTHDSVLRGFCDKWEQPISSIIEPSEKKMPLSERIHIAEKGAETGQNLSLKNRSGKEMSR